MGVILYIGPTPEDGKSAYEIAVSHGFIGSEESWLASLQGTDGKSAYQLALDTGYVGTLASWIASLRGPNGLSAYQVAISAGFTGSITEWLASLKGEPGPPGETPTLGTPSDWLIMAGSTNVIGGSGKYIKMGSWVFISGWISTNNRGATIKLPYSCTNGFSDNEAVGKDALTLPSDERVIMSVAAGSNVMSFWRHKGTDVVGYTSRFNIGYLTSE